MSRISRSSSLTSRTAPLTRWESREWARLVLSELRPPSPTLSITLPENACVTFQLQSIRYSGDYLTLLAISGYSDCAPKCPLFGRHQDLVKPTQTLRLKRYKQNLIIRVNFLQQSCGYFWLPWPQGSAVSTCWHIQCQCSVLTALEGGMGET